MRASSGHHPSFLAAALFIVTGVVALWEGRTLDVGDLESMGPGYMPRVLAVMLIVIGLAAAARGIRAKPETLGRVRARPVLAIFAAVAGFAVLAVYGGFVLSAAWLLAVSSLATNEWRAKEVLISAAILIPFTALTFIAGLGLQIKLWPW